MSACAPTAHDAAPEIERQLRAAGMGAGAAAAKAAMFQRVRAGLDAIAPESGGARAWYVPGRLEVMGKHTDYGGGRCLIAAVERGFCLMSVARSDARVRLCDVDWKSETVFSLGEAAPLGWARYPAAVAYRMARDFPELRRGVDIAFASDLPRAAGMSSSSAFIVASLIALGAANRLTESARYRRQIPNLEALAGYAAAIESGRGFGAFPAEGGVGTHGGSEDHTAILCSQAGQLKLYRFCPIAHERTVELPPGYSFVIAVSGVVASKAGEERGAYNDLAGAAQTILREWNAQAPHPAASLAQVPTPLPCLERLSPALRARWNQFVDENATAARVADCLARASADALLEAGRCVDLSQRWAEQALGNQIAETSYLQAEARRLGASASSAFGAGFGGSVWALVPSVHAARLLAEWRNAYRERFPERSGQCLFFGTGAGPAALEIELDG